MKQDIDNLEDTFDSCVIKGLIKEKHEIDYELIKSLKKIAVSGINFIKEKSKDISKSSKDWTFVFRDYYESLRCLIEAYLLFDKIKVDNHQCKNAYVCYKHPELKLDWEFLETIRLKRNFINYRGQLINYEDWKKFELQFELHIKILIEAIDKKCKN